MKTFEFLLKSGGRKHEVLGSNIIFVFTPVQSQNVALNIFLRKEEGLQKSYCGPDVALSGSDC